MKIIGILAMQPFLKIYGRYDPVKKIYFMSAGQQSLTSSIINAGEFVGAVSSYYLIEKLGRRGSLFVSSGTVIVGTIIQVASTHIGSLIAGRLVLGMPLSYCRAHRQDQMLMILRLCCWPDLLRRTHIRC